MTVHMDSYGAGKVTISGLDEDETKRLIAAIRGLSWFGFQKGQLVTESMLRPLPDPIYDEEMTPFWSCPSEEERTNLEKFVFEELDPHALYSRSITIQHLCAYNYSKANYERQSSLLNSFGFVQMRSQRGIDGGYWEKWYLSGIYAARGQLKTCADEVRSLRAKEKDLDNLIFTAALDFLRTHVEFGTLDVSVQRLCAVLE